MAKALRKLGYLYLNLGPLGRLMVEPDALGRNDPSRRWETWTEHGSRCVRVGSVRLIFDHRP